MNGLLRPLLATGEARLTAVHRLLTGSYCEDPPTAKGARSWEGQRKGPGPRGTGDVSQSVVDCLCFLIPPATDDGAGTSRVLAF